jgi:hypothetical protein
LTQPKSGGRTETHSRRRSAALSERARRCCEVIVHKSALV